MILKIGALKVDLSKNFKSVWKKVEPYLINSVEKTGAINILKGWRAAKAIECGFMGARVFKDYNDLAEQLRAELELDKRLGVEGGHFILPLDASRIKGEIADRKKKRQKIKKEEIPFAHEDGVPPPPPIPPAKSAPPPPPPSFDIIPKKAQKKEMGGGSKAGTAGVIGGAVLVTPNKLMTDLHREGKYGLKKKDIYALRFGLTCYHAVKGQNQDFSLSIGMYYSKGGGNWDYNLVAVDPNKYIPYDGIKVSNIKYGKNPAKVKCWRFRDAGALNDKDMDYPDLKQWFRFGKGLALTGDLVGAHIYKMGHCGLNVFKIIQQGAKQVFGVSDPKKHNKGGEETLFAVPVVFYTRTDPHVCASTAELSYEDYEQLASGASATGESGSVYFMVRKGALEPVGLHRGKARIDIQHNPFIKEMFPNAKDYFTKSPVNRPGWWCVQITPINKIFSHIKQSLRFKTFCNLFELDSDDVMMRFVTEKDKYNEEYAKYVFELVSDQWPAPQGPKYFDDEAKIK